MMRLHPQIALLVLALACLTISCKKECDEEPVQPAPAVVACNDISVDTLTQVVSVEMPPEGTAGSDIDSLDIDGDSVVDFKLYASRYINFYGDWNWSLSIDAVDSTHLVFAYSCVSAPCQRSLTSADEIGPNVELTDESRRLIGYISANLPGGYSCWCLEEVGYVGFVQQRNGAQYSGYLTLTRIYPGMNARILSVTLQNCPGEPIWITE